ncbi:isochorismatase family protein [Candidatus Magnetoovum chiemensis]|nr:isochorismatase family protein [Candidatus Magnetoovum chiemensis]
MEERTTVTENTANLIALCKTLKIPIILTEQYPKGIGPTVFEIKENLDKYEPIEKLSFSCLAENEFVNALEAAGKKTVVICGMETHICVLQTALDLLDKHYNVHIVSDGVTSRKQENKTVALNLMASAGAVITSTETVLFQALKKAGTEEFKLIAKRIK